LNYVELQIELEEFPIIEEEEEKEVKKEHKLIEDLSEEFDISEKFSL
jgi:hypothetical protein